MGISGAELIAVGRVLRPHGLSGEVVVECLTDFPERFVPGLSVDLRPDVGPLRRARIESVRGHQRRLLIRFEGVADTAGAEGLRDLDLCVPSAEAAPRPPGFVYHWEIAGCEAVDGEGRSLGQVQDLVETAGHHLLVVKTERGPRDVPFILPIVRSVDLEGRRVVLDPPAGLLD